MLTFAGTTDWLNNGSFQKILDALCKKTVFFMQHTKLQLKILFGVCTKIKKFPMHMIHYYMHSKTAIENSFRSLYKN